MRIVVLAGGVGAARFLSGLVRVVPPEEITVIVNTGDDLQRHGLYISPDIDIITYTLAGIVHKQQGWGIEGDTFNCLSMLEKLGDQVWFNLGDKDLGTHLYRTAKLNGGSTLAEVTDEIRRTLGVGIEIIPMSNDPVTTKIQTDSALITFQEYLVQRGARDRVAELVFAGIEDAEPAPGVMGKIESSAGVIIAPSNPLVSIGTILNVKGIREALQKSPAPVIGVSPIVGGKTIKGPADRMMGDLGHEVSPVGVARYYHDFMDAFVIDQKDGDLKGEIEGLGMEVIVTDTIMSSQAKKVELAHTVIRWLGV